MGLFRKETKKAEGIFCFLAVAANSPLYGSKNKKLVKDGVYKDLFPTPMLEMAGVSIGTGFRTGTIIYPWEWDTPAVLDLMENEEHLSSAWDAVFAYMKQTYGFDDYWAMDEKAQTSCSANNSSAALVFYLKS
jgi:hypothetical protein